ncbi:hypothetical protein ACFXNW_15990 [Nocardia sp. NPDC059180]|uniref:hypothetical protein n=1 Tax=Nocardia sp. NPDC059180 TaxID=3346761 RepID=UPI0036B97E24
MAVDRKFAALLGGSVTMAAILALATAAVSMLRTATLLGISLGIALSVFAVMTGTLVIRQISFGLSADRLFRRMEAENDARCYVELPRSPSGRVPAEAAAQYRTECISAVTARPDDWREWFLLAGAHQIARDHRRAVEALRQATALSRSTPVTTPP